MRNAIASGDSPERQAKPADDPEATLPGSRPLRIIVADDDQDTAKTLTVILEDEGHKVRPVYHSSEVMAAVRNFEPDAIILDIAMPGDSGYSLAGKIRSWFTSYRPMLIAISGVYVRPTDALLSQAVGFDHHLKKPCDINELVALLAPLTRKPR